MKSKNLRIIALTCVCAMTILLTACNSQTAASDPAEQTADTSAAEVTETSVDEATAKAAQTALDYQAIENIMSRHVYYHCYGQHGEELEAIWVQEAENQATASFGNNNGFWVGYDNIWTSYVDAHLENWISSAKSYCENNGIEVTDEELEDYYGVAQILMHCTTTEVLEVAADGLTARGVWYSPGMICESGTSANWIWEKYAVDFVKENGEWKMWHLHMFTDFMCAFGDSFTSSTGMGEMPEGEMPSDLAPAGEAETGGAPVDDTGKGGASTEQQLSDTEYTLWSADRQMSDWLNPEIPLSYESFSFESSYGPSIEQYESLGIDLDAWYTWADSQT